MKYLVLKKRPGTPENPFTEIVAARGRGDEFDSLFEAETHDLEEPDADDLRRDPDVEDVVLSMPFTLEPVSDQTTTATDAETAWGLEAIGATQSSQTGAGVTVAILDTGIDVAHDAFKGFKFNPNDLKDFTVTKDGKGVAGAAPDVWGHGTHVAGTLFGREVNGKRIGVAPGIQRALIGKVLKPEGAGTEALYHALIWALEEGADIISMSLSINFPKMVERFIENGLPPDIAASRALEGFRANVRVFDDYAKFVSSHVRSGRGALLVAASGNASRRNKDKRFTVAVAPPATAEGFISVGAVRKTGDPASPFAVADFSNTGCLLSAPGVGILSARLGGGLVTDSGTSMATPHVAGVIALWIEKLFRNGERPPDWARDVQRKVESGVTVVPGQSRGDIGLGVVTAPQ